jgi:hypothetical protein
MLVAPYREARMPSGFTARRLGRNAAQQNTQAERCLYIGGYTSGPRGLLIAGRENDRASKDNNHLRAKGFWPRYALG